MLVIVNIPGKKMAVSYTTQKNAVNYWIVLTDIVPEGTPEYVGLVKHAFFKMAVLINILLVIETRKLLIWLNK